MRNRILIYAFGLLTLGFFTACAQNRFEWVKVNPEKVYLSKSGEAQSNSVRYVDLFLQLKEKDRIVSYNESDKFFATQSYNENTYVNPSVVRRSGKKTHSRRVAKATAPQDRTPLLVSKVHHPESVNPTEANKLNDALKIPVNSKALKSNPKQGSFGSSAAEVRALAFKNIKEKNPELEKRSQDKEKRGKNLMWAGLVLFVIGGIMGIIVGKSAFLISLAGIVFGAIGYFFRI